MKTGDKEVESTCFGGCRPAEGWHDSLGHICSCEEFARRIYADESRHSRNMAFIQSPAFDEMERISLLNSKNKH